MAEASPLPLSVLVVSVTTLSSLSSTNWIVTSRLARLAKADISTSSPCSIDVVFTVAEIETV